MSAGGGMTVTIRRLGPDDGAAAAATVQALKQASSGPAADFLADPRNHLVAAFDEREPVGFALGYLLHRVDDAGDMMFIYEIEVAATHRRLGIGTALIEALLDVPAAKAFVFTDPGGGDGSRFYPAIGATRFPDQAMFGWGQRPPR